MYILDINKLQCGDILLSTQKHPVSKSIRFVTGSKYSHAMLYVGEGSLIHADGNGVHSQNIQRMLFEKEDYILALRVGDEAIANKAQTYAQNQIGKEYSVSDAVKTKISVGEKEAANRQFCSRLIAQSYEYAGLSLVADSDFCAPQDLLDSAETEVVPSYTREATKEEILFSKSPSPIKLQADITNQIMEQSRELTGHDIQTFQDLTQFVLDNPVYDEDLTSIVKESGYLDMWRWEVERNPWRYDSDLFLKLPIPDEEILARAEGEIPSADKQIKQYMHNQQMYADANSQKEREFLKVHIELMGNLIQKHMERRVTAEYVATILKHVTTH